MDTTKTSWILAAARRSGVVDAVRDHYRGMPNEEMKDAYDEGWSTVRPVPSHAKVVPLLTTQTPAPHVRRCAECGELATRGDDIPLCDAC
jgi:hypothetical protein